MGICELVEATGSADIFMGLGKPRTLFWCGGDELILITTQNVLDVFEPIEVFLIGDGAGGIESCSGILPG